ncbi:MAG: hypothetical protein H7039_17315, partial [Bryobacteraceae bacterium]|nr:hypothetical protein [Bryobacteraceae bacterium]
RVEYLTSLLTLQPSQVTLIRAVLTEEQTSSSAVQTSLGTARTALRDAVDALSPDATLDRLAATTGQLGGQLDAIHAKAQVKLLNVLTAEQRTKLNTLDGGGFGRGLGGPGRRGGPFPQ